MADVVKASYYYMDPETKFDAKTLESSPLTHLFVAFAQIDPRTYEVDVSTINLAQVKSITETDKVKSKRLRVLLSIGGKDARKSVFDSMTNKQENRKAFIDSSISVAREYNLQGLDLAWDPINKVEKDNFEKLIKEWRQAVKDEWEGSSMAPLLLTAAVYYTPVNNSVQYPVQAIAKYLDFVNIKSYDFCGPDWSPVTGPPAALYDPSNPEGICGESGLRKWLEAKLPADRAVFGFSYYGRAWTLKDPKDNGYGAPTDGPAITPDGSVTYDGIKNFIVGSGAATCYDPEVVGCYCYAGTTWIGYDDNQSIVTKVKYATQNGLRGYFSWNIEADCNGGLTRAASLAWDTTDTPTGK